MRINPIKRKGRVDVQSALPVEQFGGAGERLCLTVYHASDRIVDIHDIEFPGPRNNCDFGNGFYLSEIRHVAEEWVIRRTLPIINEYMLETSKKDILYLDGKDWVKTIVGFREKAYRVHFKSPIICGPIANDRMNDALPLFMRGIIGDLRLLKCLDYCKLGNQYLLRQSPEYLTFVRSYSLKGTELQRAWDRYNNRRKRMSSELINIQRLSLNGERYIENYLEEGDYFES